MGVQCHRCQATIGCATAHLNRRWGSYNRAVKLGGAVVAKLPDVTKTMDGSQR